MSLRWALEPILGDRVKGWVGDLIDVLAIFGTLFGIATSLGLGVQQIAAGMEAIGIVDQADLTLLVVLIVVITFLATLSVVSGIGAGIKWLSNINLSLAGFVMVSMLLLGPTLFLLENFVESLGVYLGNVLNMTFDIGAYHGEAGHKWFADWTIFYWAWWISWTPFVGMFIARISRGRTIRQFIAGVMLLPSLVSLLWFCIFGGATIHAQQGGAGFDKVSSAEGTLFALLHTLPLGSVMSVLVMVLVAIFFVSGADAASIVMGTLSENGSMEPRSRTVVFWGIATGAVAIVMLVAGGKDALNGLQAITIVAGLPFLIVMIGMAISLTKELSTDPLIVRGHYAKAAVEKAVVDGVKAHGDDFELVVAHTEGHPAPKADVTGQ